jgi:16S rRNA (guanine527-N7)-methyltransferase
MVPLQVADALEPLLTDARRLGFLGPGPVNDQITRSAAFATVAGMPPQGLAADLGRGGGLPALVLALLWPVSQWVLIDSNGRRASWLERAVDRLGIASRVNVHCERAELSGRGPLRQTAELVTARGFGSPAATAECAAGLLRLGGHLVVAGPPGHDEGRWPPPGLAILGLELEMSEVVKTGIGPVSMSRMLAASDCGPKYPRRVGVPFKRPLF